MPDFLADRPMARAVPRPLLPNEPGVADAAAQGALTARHLIPALDTLEALLRHFRALVDRDLAGTRSWSGKPYPLGLCLEITRAVEAILDGLDRLDLASLPTEARAGAAALVAFRRAGGAVRRAWGALREQYFQNALVIGTLYVDVANDTVVPTKPKVEIKPFADAAFRALRDYRHYAAVARTYWSARVHPNHLLPDLAPYFPLLMLFPDGRLTVKCDTAYMTCLTLRAAFAPSAEVLAAPPLDDGLFAAARAALGDSVRGLPGTAEEGRRAALGNCAAFRAAGWQASGERARLAAAGLSAANHALSSVRIASEAGTQ